jgi:hypothetical protein
MQVVKFYLIFLLLFIFSCQNKIKTSNSQQKYDFMELNVILKGETLSKKHNQKSTHYKTSNYTCDAIYVGNTNISNEINLVFKNTDVDSCYKSLNSYYNTHFNSTRHSKPFNSWSTDSLEVLLFKQTDSTILVNIFIKTYR